MPVRYTNVKTKMTVSVWSSRLWLFVVPVCASIFCSTTTAFVLLDQSKKMQSDIHSRIIRSKISLAATLHNFGPASDRDEILFTAERPGNPSEKTGTVENASVEAWIDFMKERDIQKVVVLLDDNEFECYKAEDSPGLLNMYTSGGLDYLVQPMRNPEACQNILDYIQKAQAKKEKVVAHCTGGIGRAGRVAAAWLVEQYDLSPEEATKQALSQAAVSGIKRKGDANMLEAWMKKPK